MGPSALAVGFTRFFPGLGDLTRPNAGDGWTGLLYGPHGAAVPVLMIAVAGLFGKAEYCHGSRDRREVSQRLMDRRKGDSSLKTVSLDSPQYTLEGLLREAAGGEVIFLTTDGLPRFALVAVDEGDQEAFALRSNTEFMAYLDECKQRVRQGPTKSLEEIKRLFAEEKLSPGP